MNELSVAQVLATLRARLARSRSPRPSSSPQASPRARRRCRIRRRPPGIRQRRHGRIRGPRRGRRRTRHAGHHRPRAGRPRLGRSRGARAGGSNDDRSGAARGCRCRGDERRHGGAGDHVRVLRAVRAGQNVRRRSEHVRAGEAVLLAGRRLRSHDIGLAASVGAATVSVFRRLRVAILSTGDELVDAPAPLAGSAAYDGNRPLLRRSSGAPGPT